MIDAYMVHAIQYVKLIVFDAESCNHLVRSCIHGCLEATYQRRLGETQFFQTLRHSKISGLESLPRFPISICQAQDNECIYALPGPAHAGKNAVGQMQSEGRLLFYGDYMCDSAGTLEYSMPLPAFTRKDAMSDRLAALLSCPLFCVAMKEIWHNLGGVR